MEKNELGLRDLVSEWLDGDSDVRYRDPDEKIGRASCRERV